MKALLENLTHLHRLWAFKTSSADCGEPEDPSVTPPRSPRPRGGMLSASGDIFPMTQHEDNAKLQDPIIRRYARGEVISREGDEDFGWFVLRQGRVGVFKGDVQIDVFHEPGMVFGELSGILRRPRTASLVALDACEVLYLTASLDELIAHHPTVVKKIVETLAERLAKTTDNLWMRASGS